MKLIIKKIAISILRIIAKFITSIVKILFKMPLTKEIIGDELSKATEACVHAIRKSTNAKVTKSRASTSEISSGVSSNYCYKYFCR